MALDLEHTIGQYRITDNFPVKHADTLLGIVNFASQDESLQHVLVIETFCREVQSSETELVAGLVLDVKMANVNFGQIVKNAFEWETFV